MCGIVGIVGAEPVALPIVDALKRLEYRGYDSAGVATVVDGHIARRRVTGKLRGLDAALHEDKLPGNVGIGHTRWATHGVPSEANAHPHATAKVAIVHNGIIENFRALRQELADGFRDDRPSHHGFPERRKDAGRGRKGGNRAARRRLRHRHHLLRRA
jgi:glucosamine--fructose-6-phosphate aminotransferase (isomerizing)